MLRRAFLAALMAFPLIAASPIWTGKDGKSPAAEGNDVVSYFSGEPLVGTPELSTEYQDARFQFATPENLAAFKATPGRYLPQYGGHCAWAASEGRRAGGNPSVWKIVEGKLYFNCSKDAEAKWQADLQANITKADEWWAWEGAW